MPRISTIQLRALFLTAVFAGNFLVVCPCSAAAEPSVSLGMHGHCCCGQTAAPCKHRKTCPGMRAVKFNLLEKQAAPTVCLNPVDTMVYMPGYTVPAVECRLAPGSALSLYLSPHAPPDRLALYQCYLI